MSLWRLSRQSDMGSLIWVRTPGVALAALVYPRLPSLTTSWSVLNPHETRMDLFNRPNLNLNLTLNLNPVPSRVAAGVVRTEPLLANRRDV